MSSLAAPRGNAGGCMLAATATASRLSLFSSTCIDGFARRRASDVSRAPARVARSPRRRATMDASEDDSDCSSQRWESPGYETLRLLVPELDCSRYHKGQAGKIGVVGGCSEYTGAPYFAAMSALRMGADLAHVFCAEGAGQVIKSYSPELIVHPYLREGVKDVTVTVDGEEVHAVTYDEDAVFEAMEKVTPWLHRMDAIVVGPGLGRDPTMSEIAKRIIAFAHERDVPLVIDADGLRVLMEDQGLIGGPGRAVLTPNKAELGRFSAQIARTRGDPPPETTMAQARYVTAQLDGPVVVAKGEVDIVALDVVGESTGPSEVGRRISSFRRHLVCDEPGSPRRCGGQGDVLAGSIATFLAWAARSKEAERAIARRIDVEGDHVDGDLIAAAGDGPGYETHPSLGPSAVSVVAAYAGCLVTRVAARAAFKRKRRSMLATDVIEELGETMQRLFPVYVDED